MDNRVPETLAEVQAAVAANGWTLKLEYPRSGRVVADISWGGRNGVRLTGREEYAVSLLAYKRALVLAPLPLEGR